MADLSKTEKAIQALAVAIQARIPTVIVGPPGIGKTKTMAAISDSLEWLLETIILSIREPSDLGGLPVRMLDGTVMLSAPAWAHRLASAGAGILFIDEISTAAPALQAAALRVIQEGVVGDLHLPETVARVAAMNPPELAAGGWSLSAPLANRFCHLEWPASDSGYWVRGTLSGWPMPRIPMLREEWQRHVPSQAAMVTAFIQARPELLHRVPKDEAGQGGPWPSQRTWTMAAELMAACDGVVDDDIKQMLIGGCVGWGTAGEFLTWQDALDLPNPEDCLAHPERFTFPKRSDQQYALFAAVSSAVIQKNTPERWLSAFKVFKRATEHRVPDTAVIAIEALLKNKPEGIRQIPGELSSFAPLFRDAGLMNGH